MIIASKNLPTYFHGLTFPVSVLSEIGPKEEFRVQKSELLRLIEANCVIGIGSYNRLRSIRLNRPVEVVTRLRMATYENLRALPMAGDVLQAVKHNGRETDRRLRMREVEKTLLPQRRETERKLLAAVGERARKW